MVTKYKKTIEPVIAIIAQPFLSWNPHVLTLLSVVFALGFTVSLAYHNYVLAGISWVGIIFDALDGYVARKKGKETKFGAFFDSTMDRISDFFYISAFGFAGFIPWELVSIAIIITLLISYTRARGESLLPKDMVFSEGLMQRTERLITLFVVFLLFVANFAEFALFLFVLFVILGALSSLQRILFIKRLLS